MSYDHQARAVLTQGQPVWKPRFHVLAVPAHSGYHAKRHYELAGKVAYWAARMNREFKSALRG